MGRDRVTIFCALTCQEEQPHLVIVFSILVIAALFNPQKRRKQGFVDRCFYTQRSAVEEHSPNVVELGFSEDRAQNPVLSLALIHPSAWNRYSRMFPIPRSFR
jgi:hypothetical protein